MSENFTVENLSLWLKSSWLKSSWLKSSFHKGLLVGSDSRKNLSMVLLMSRDTCHVTPVDEKKLTRSKKMKKFVKLLNYISRDIRRPMERSSYGLTNFSKNFSKNLSKHCVIIKRHKIR